MRVSWMNHRSKCRDPGNLGNGFRVLLAPGIAPSISYRGPTSLMGDKNIGTRSSRLQPILVKIPYFFTILEVDARLNKSF